MEAKSDAPTTIPPGQDYSYDQPGQPGAMPPAYQPTPQMPSANVTIYPGYGPPPVMAQPQMQAGPPTVTVIMQQPKLPQRDWSKGICDCFHDMNTCCLVTWCSPCVSCQLSERMGEGFCMPCIVPHGLIPLRLKLRMEQNIKGNIFEDCLALSFCGCCALCQMKMEHDLVTRASIATRTAVVNPNNPNVVVQQI